MTKRFFLAQNRLLISLPGYEASPSTPFEGISFDSDTPFGGLVLTRGMVNDTSPVAQNNNLRTYDTTFDFACPGLRTGYSTLLFLTYDSADTTDGRQSISDLTLIEATYVNATTLRVKRPREVGDTYTRFANFAGNPLYFMVLAS